MPDDSGPRRFVEVSDTSIESKAVDEMAKLMKRELDENQDKKGGRASWLTGSAKAHVLETYYHTGKLQAALNSLQTIRDMKDASRHEIEYHQELIKEYAADVANHALMVLDVLGLLGLPEPVKEEPKKATPARQFSPPTLDSDNYGHGS